MATLPEWKIRERFNLIGNVRTPVRSIEGVVRGPHNKYWNFSGIPRPLDFAEGWREDTEDIRAEEDELWEAIKRFVLGATTAFRLAFATNSDPPKEVRQSLFKLIRSCPDLPTRVQERLFDNTHPQHFRYVVCIESLFRREAKKFERATVSTLGNMSTLPGWKFMIPRGFRVSVFVVRQGLDGVGSNVDLVRT